MIIIEEVRNDAHLVAIGLPVAQHQEALQEQLEELARLAGLFGLYDAQDFIQRHHLAR